MMTDNYKFIIKKIIYCKWRSQGWRKCVLAAPPIASIQPRTKGRRHLRDVVETITVFIIIIFIFLQLGFYYFWDHIVWIETSAPKSKQSPLYHYYNIQLFCVKSSTYNRDTRQRARRCLVEFLLYNLVNKIVFTKLNKKYTNGQYDQCNSINSEFSS